MLLGRRKEREELKFTAVARELEQELEKLIL